MTGGDIDAPLLFTSTIASLLAFGGLHLVTVSWEGAGQLP